ncbi:hypothetical protein ACLD0W_02120 [Alloalcanivorax sp. C16-1]|uniref:hypothetical protein n=1 Tax=Alloalcanivorax sp. C16-1 TaxID=3390051 RepID=UPI00397067EF
MKLKNALPITLLAAALAACGGDDDTRYVDRDDPTPVEYMPVDGYVLGFWVMDTQDDCDGPCINDHSPYGDPLYGLDAAGQPAAPALNDGGEVGRVAVFADNYRLVTRDTGSLNNSVIGERFSVHLRARTDQTDAVPVMALAGDGGTALRVSLARDRLLVELPSQNRRLLTGLEAGDGWREIQLTGDGQRVTLSVDCETVEGFDVAPGVPVLSSGPVGAVVGDGFTGAVDLVRISRREEGNLFCAD